VANFTSGTVSVIDTGSETVSDTITVGTGPSGIAINPAGTVAYVTNTTDGTVSVIDLTTNSVSTTISVGNGPLEVAFNPEGTIAYTANNTAGTVSVLDVGTNSVSGTISVGTNPQGVSFRPNSVISFDKDSSIKDEFFIEDEYSSKITWRTTGSFSFFRIYRDPAFTDLAGISHISEFVDHNRRPGEVSQYFIQGVQSTGNFVYIGEIAIETPGKQL
jgi:YVTN family beta-propeller protein